jgi:hypothetical protein
MRFRTRILLALTLIGVAPLSMGALVFACTPTARADPAPLAIRADPARLLLGTDPVAVLVVEGATETPTFTASVGEVRGVESAGAGRYEAHFLPPREAWPQVAIVTASAGGRFAWTALPLHGRGIAVAHTRPHASIRVTIAGADFGPAPADHRGEAHIPVIVPPGVGFAYQGKKPLDLHVPPALHVHVVPERRLVRGDRDEVVPLRVLAVSPDGSPRAQAPPELSATAGELDPVEEIAPGEYVSRWRLARGPAGEVRVTARLADEEPSRTVAIRREPGPPARVQVEPDVTVAVAGRLRPIALRIRVADAAGNAVDAVPDLASSFGSVSPAEARGQGLYESTLVVPQERDGHGAATVTARVADVTGTASVELTAGPAERIVVDGADEALIADGTREAVLRVALLDRFGNEAAAEPAVALAIGDGAVRSRPDGAGGHEVHYRPRRTREDEVHVVTIRAGGLEAEARLPIVAPVRRFEAAPKLGFALSMGGLRTPVAAAEVAFWPERLEGRVGVLLEAGTFVFDRTEAVAAGAGTLDVAANARYSPILLSASWRSRRVGRVRWWASAGAGPALLSSEVAASSQPAVREAGWIGAAHVSAGADVPFGPGLPFAEARLAWHSDPALESLRGTLTSLALSIGYRYEAY